MRGEGELPLTEEEARWVVMRRRGFKAPGPDMVYGKVLPEIGILSGQMEGGPEDSAVQAKEALL